MKKAIIACLAIVLVAAGAVSFFVYGYYRQPLVTGNVKNLSTITVIKDGFNQDGIKKALAPSDAKALFEEIKGTKTMAVRHPKQLDRMHLDSLYIIEVYYKNGKVDTIYTTEVLKLFRFIDTKGPDGDSGYMLSSKNEKIFSLLENYF
ncbi:MAG: hypothetical protein FWF05_01220 [Oscillospiraceae bacterium]|nr:hypothetical protein [Oscillospiraceae bacterium]